jgi:soluble lytic murein transglycosylase-like protein
VLGLVQVESGFRKYAISSAGARGYMQVMPFWAADRRWRRGALFHMQTNLRFGCVILRHYLDLSGRPVPGAGPLQRQPRQARIPACRVRGAQAVAAARRDVKGRESPQGFPGVSSGIAACGG